MTLLTPGRGRRSTQRCVPGDPLTSSDGNLLVLKRAGGSAHRTCGRDAQSSKKPSSSRDAQAHGRSIRDRVAVPDAGRRVFPGRELYQSSEAVVNEEGVCLEPSGCGSRRPFD